MLEKYITDIKKLNKKFIYGYGAGVGARALLHLCKENGIALSGFCVTDITINQADIEGISVIQYDQLQYDAYNTLFLICAMEKGPKKIRKYLIDTGAKYIMDFSRDLLTLDDYMVTKRKRPTLEITPQVGCSVHCYYCPQKLLISRYFSLNAHRKNKLSLEDYKIILKHIPGDTLIEFAGFVEPFLHPGAVELMECSFEQGHDVTLYTTMVGLDVQKLKQVLDLQFTRVVLHVPDKEGLANIPITKEYLNLLDMIINAKKKNGMPFVDSVSAQSKPHPEVLQILDRKVKTWCNLDDRAGCLDSNDVNLAHASHKGIISCTRADNLDHFVLLPDGTVVLCCNDFGLQHIMGNLIYDSYEEIIHGEEMRRIKRAMKIDDTIPTICRKCLYAIEEGDSCEILCADLK